MSVYIFVLGGNNFICKKSIQNQFVVLCAFFSTLKELFMPMCRSPPRNLDFKFQIFRCKCQYKIDKKIQNKIDKKIQYKLCEISNICFDISLCFYNLKNASSFI